MVAASVVPVSPEFGYVVLTASASAILTQWQMFQVPEEIDHNLFLLCVALCVFLSNFAWTTRLWLL